MSSPLLSVCLITYNHVKFIRESIDSILVQQTDFKLELIIADDFSTDGTRNLILEYQNKHPDIIRLILQKKNVGPAQNWMDLIRSPKSKYIVYIEGDDYWTDPYKLQKQVDFLENNPDYNICFHNVKVYNESTQQFVTDYLTREVAKTTSLKDLAIDNYIHTPSVVFRNKSIVLPEWFINLPIGDYPLWCITALDGLIYKIDEEMAVYRVHDKGAMSGFKKQNIPKKIAFNDGLIPFYEYIYKKSNIDQFRKTLILLLIANQSYAIRLNNYKLARKYAFRIYEEHLFCLTKKQITSTFLTIFAPTSLKNRYASN